MPKNDRLLNAIEAIHAAGIEPEHWPKALAAVTGLCGGVGATLEVFDKRTQSHNDFHAVDVPLDLEKAYLDYWAPRSPRVIHGQRMKTGEIGWDYQFLDEAGMDRDGFYSELLPITDFRYFVSATLANSPAEYAVVAVQRTRRQGHVGESEIAAMRRLVPHLQQALDVSARLNGARLAMQAFEQALDWLDDGAALLRRDGGIVFCNERFRRIAQKRDGVWIEKGAVTFAAGACRTSFARGLTALQRVRDGDAGTLPPCDFTVPRLSGDPHYVVSLRPLGGAARRPQSAVAILFVRDPVADSSAAVRLLRDMFGFTAAEANLAQALQSGVSPAAYAREHRLSPNTVYTHLRRLKEKTGWRRTAELTRRLRQLQVPSRPD